MSQQQTYWKDVLLDAVEDLDLKEEEQESESQPVLSTEEIRIAQSKRITAYVQYLAGGRRQAQTAPPFVPPTPPRQMSAKTVRLNKKWGHALQAAEAEMNSAVGRLRLPEEVQIVLARQDAERARQAAETQATEAEQAWQAAKQARQARKRQQRYLFTAVAVCVPVVAGYAMSYLKAWQQVKAYQTF